MREAGNPASIRVGADSDINKSALHHQRRLAGADGGLGGCGCGCAGASLELAGWRMPDGSLVLLLVNLLDQPRALTLSLPAPAGGGEAIAEAWVIFEQNRRINVRPSTRF